jgi:hypothetical protein
MTPNELGWSIRYATNVFRDSGLIGYHRGSIRVERLAGTLRSDEVLQASDFRPRSHDLDLL